VYGVCVLVIVIVAAIFANNWTTPVYRDGNPTSTALPWTPPQPVEPDPLPSSPDTSPEESPTPSETPTVPPTTMAPDPNAPYRYSGVEIPAVSASGKQYRYLIEVENGVSLDPDNTAEAVAAVVNDPRSWAGIGNVRFSQVNSTSKADVFISFANAETQSKTCGSDLVCKSGNKIIISAAGWDTTPAHFANATDYHTYLVNYGFGLAQSQKPKSCPGKGKPAPIMQQQWADLAGCRATSWVY
jgi:hypothetical protein